MINKLHAKISFKWVDFWIGWFWDLEGKAFYLCLLPMVPIKIWTTEHKKCPTCGSVMNKSAYDTGDGWALFWDCEKEPGNHCVDMDWPFKDEYKTVKDLRRLGFELA